MAGVGMYYMKNFEPVHIYEVFLAIAVLAAAEFLSRVKLLVAIWIARDQRRAYPQEHIHGLFMAGSTHQESPVMRRGLHGHRMCIC